MEGIGDFLPSLPLWLVWPVVTGITVYWYLTKNHDYFKKLGIPYASPVPLFGSMGKLFLSVMHQTELERYMKKGKIYGSFEGSTPVLNVADPELLRDILVKDFQHFSGPRKWAITDPVVIKMLSFLSGEDWKRVRAMVTPAFTTGKIKKMTSIFTDSAKTIAENFKTSIKSGNSIEVKSYFAAYTMDVTASSAFGTKIDSHNDPNNIFVTNARGVFNRKFPWRFALMFMFPGFVKMFNISIFAPGIMDFFKNVTLEIIKERKAMNKTRNDFLQLMMECAKESSEGRKIKEDPKDDEEDIATHMGHEEGNAEVFKPIYITKTMSEDELVAQCITFFIAGSESLATVMTLTAYEMALNPEVQEKLIAEIDETIRKKGELTYERICEMNYLDAVISETLRKYPPAIRTERQADSDYQLKGTDITVPKGMVVGIPVYAIHHDPENYPNPEKYDPERFTSDQKDTRHSYTYLPFGAGPRNCVGMRFALMEIKVCLVNVLKQFRFKRCPETKIPLQFYKGQILIQPRDVILKVEIRTDAAKPSS